MKTNSILITLLGLMLSSCLTLEKPVIIGSANPVRQFDFETKIETDSCYDLMIKSIKVLEKRKNDIILEYTIKNDGTAAISIDGQGPSKGDNIGIQVFFSGDEKYNRGDLLVDGFFIEKPKDREDGLIQPDETYKAQLIIKTKRKTSYHSSIILHIDPMQVFKECDETNNYTSIRF